MLAYCWC